MKFTFSVQPQRSDGRGWFPCEQHQATSFVVLQMQSWTSRGRKFTSSRVVSRHGGKNEALGEMAFRARAHAPTPKHLIRKLGRRIVKELQQ